MASVAPKLEIVHSEAPEANAVSDQSTEPETRPEASRLLEALLFAAADPLDEATLAKQLPNDVNIKEALAQLQAEYSTRGVNLVRVGKKWAFRTAGDLSWLLTKHTVEQRKLSRAAIETLAIIAYHQPVTRAEIEEIRGVQTAGGTIDVLLKTDWIRPRGRRKVPGRPITYGTTENFLAHFGLEEVSDLPGLEELKGAGLLEGGLPTGFAVPVPSDDSTLREDEDPLEPGDLDLGLAPAVEGGPEAEAGAAAETEGDAVADGAAEAHAEAEAETGVDAETDAVAEDEAYIEGEIEAEDESDGDAEAVAELEAEAEAEAGMEADAEAPAEGEGEPQDESEPDGEAGK